MTPAHDNPNRAPTDKTALYLLATCHCLVKRLLNRSNIGSYSSPHKGARWSPEQRLWAGGRHTSGFRPTRDIHTLGFLLTTRQRCLLEIRASRGWLAEARW